MLRKIMLLAALLFTQSLQAANPNVFELSVNKPMAEIYGPLYQALEADGFFVVFEADIGANLARFAEKWGDNYNRSQLEAIRSMVFCNGWYANAVSNADPGMLALCPLRLTLIQKQGSTRVLFVKPTAVAGDSPARNILQRVETDVTAVIRKVLQGQ